jgi:hypothetical protein
MSGRLKVPPHLRRIAEAISQGDYTVLRNGGEKLVFQYAKQFGVSPAELIRSWGDCAAASPYNTVADRTDSFAEADEEDDVDDEENEEADDRRDEDDIDDDGNDPGELNQDNETDDEEDDSE